MEHPAVICRCRFTNFRGPNHLQIRFGIVRYIFCFVCTRTLCYLPLHRQALSTFPAFVQFGSVRCIARVLHVCTCIGYIRYPQRSPPLQNNNISNIPNFRTTQHHEIQNGRLDSVLFQPIRPYRCIENSFYLG